ncbi:hypothetical protein RJ640_015050, partial [Escallonia rubra]
ENAPNNSSEFVGTDQIKNQTPGKSHHGDATGSGTKKSSLDEEPDRQHNKESSSCKAENQKSKQNKMCTASQYNDTGNKSPGDTSVKSASLEATTCSMPTRKKRLRKRRKRGKDALNSNDTHNDHLEAMSSRDCNPRDSSSPLVVHTCVKAESKTEKHVDEQSLSGDVNGGKKQNERHNALETAEKTEKHADEQSLTGNVNGGKKQNERHNALETAENIHNLNQRGGRPSPNITDINSGHHASSRSFSGLDLGFSSEVIEQLCGSSKWEDINSVKKHDDLDVDVEDASHEGRSMKTYHRRKHVDFNENKLPECLEANEEGPGPNKMPMLENERVSTCLDCSSEALASSCVEKTLEGEEAAEHGSSPKVVRDTLVENSICGFSNQEDNRFEFEKTKETAKEDSFPKDASVVDCVVDSFPRAKMAKLMVKENTGSLEYKEEIPVCKTEEASSAASGRDPPPQTLEIQSKMGKEKRSVTEVDAMEDGVIHVENLAIRMQSSIGRVLGGSFKKKLLVLDVNGLLADIVSGIPNGYKAHAIIGNKAVFKRPFCDEFLQFCFERFSVGVWSSRTRRNVQMVVDFLMGLSRHNLLFCWDQSRCTKTDYNTIENRDKPIVLKELKKLWEKHDSQLPWQRGEYDASNTLLLDDSPYKALLNPPHTAIFPHPYQYTDKKDNSLGPGGTLHAYLEQLAVAENVQKYVEQNPFGQRPITKKNASWGYYLKIIRSTSSQQGSYQN